MAASRSVDRRRAERQAPRSAAPGSLGGRGTNLALLALLPAALLSGTVAYGLGAPSGRAVVVAHGVVGLGVLALSPWKAAIARRGVRRGNRGRSASLVLALLVVVAVASGLAHAAGVRTLPLVVSAMHLHVGAGLAALPLAVWHVVARPVRPRGADASRRTVVRAAVLGGTAGALWGGAELAHHLLGTAGADRRFTGSHEQGTDDPARMPVIQWLLDEVQHLDPAGWRLVVRGLDGAVREVGLDELRGEEETVRAAIDCTSGWWAAQDWHGVRLDRVVGPVGGARSVVVSSTTGYARRFPVRDLPRLWLATAYGDLPLRAAHGAPVRLVAPGRRGFWWVKWVTDVRLDDAPWWRQPPFPLR